MKRTGPILAAAGALLALGAPLAAAEVTQKEGVRVSVSGKMTPSRLPRTALAPIAVSVGGQITTADGTEPPQLMKMAIAINSHGRLATGGIPRCHIGRITPSTTAQARAACGASLIGEGTFSAHVTYPEQSPFPSEGKVLAFNGRLRGRPAIFAHIYGTKPVPTSYTLPFTIRSSKGTYGTILEASFPRVTGEWGFVTGLSMTLKRTFSSHGRQLNYLSASCPAPKGFNSVPFPLLRTTFSFDGGLDLTSVLNRSCKVK